MGPRGGAVRARSGSGQGRLRIRGARRLVPCPLRRGELRCTRKRRRRRWPDLRGQVRDRELPARRTEISPDDLRVSRYGRALFFPVLNSLMLQNRPLPRTAGGGDQRPQTSQVLGSPSIQPILNPVRCHPQKNFLLPALKVTEISPERFSNFQLVSECPHARNGFFTHDARKSPSGVKYGRPRFSLLCVKTLTIAFLCLHA